MINSDLQQELRSKYNPDGSMLRTLQLNLTDMLIELDRVCKKNGINYWLDMGTLLGAARHKGFIPWDDDLDVCILKSDRKKLKKALKKDLNPPFSFVDANTKDGRPRRWARVINNSIIVSRVADISEETGEKNIRDEKLWLDVFLLINATVETSKKVDRFFGRCYRRRHKLINDGKFKHIIGVCLFPIAQLMAMIVTAWGKLFRRNYLVFDFSSGFYYQRKADEIYPLGELEFEGHRFPAPCNYDKYLNRIYGDWKKIPDNIYNHNIFQIKNTDSAYI